MNRGGEEGAVPIDPEPEEVLARVRSLEGGRFEAVEVFAKKGRSRRVTVAGDRSCSVYAEERGWAVRAGDRRASFFAAASGSPLADFPWPEPDGLGLQLPGPQAAAAWNPSSDFESPLIGDREGTALLDGIARALVEELPGARLLQAAVEDGASESQLISSRGVRARHRSRLSSLHLEVQGPGAASPPLNVYLAERDARRFNPLGLARRLADRLMLEREGRPRERDRGDFLLAPPLMIRLLEGLAPLLVGPAALRRVEALAGPGRRLGGEALTVLDDGRLPGGALEAPVDGEGIPTRETVLIDHGVFRQPLLAWWQVERPAERESGCSRRAGWRDLPAPGPTHLYLRPRSGIAVADLLGEIARGYYLLEATGPGSFDIEENRFDIPVCGFEVRSGRATAPVAGSRLQGRISALLASIQAVARDLSFLPLAGMIGSPTVLASGLELRGG